MYMVDIEQHDASSFGFTDQDKNITVVSYSSEEGTVQIGDEYSDFRVYAKDVPNLIKALEHMKKYLIDEKII